jgi:hypothetical protein
MCTYVYASVGCARMCMLLLDVHACVCMCVCVRVCAGICQWSGEPQLNEMDII